VVEQSVKEITPKELIQWKANGEEVQVIDVREPKEYETANIGAELIPLDSIIENVHKIARNKKVVVHCKTGRRSIRAIRELQQKFGFDNLYNLKGGIVAYLER
jgi:adenylyltransferase/sulfurtransferase